MIIAGIDQSLNSTGITIWNSVTEKHEYFLIVSKLTRKMENFSSPHIHIIQYDKIQAQCEVDKFKSISNLVDEIETILIDYKVDQVVLEGVAYNAVGRTSDLTGLNYLIRNVCYNNDIPFVVIPATTVKKEFTGNGGATKEIMIWNFFRVTNLSSTDFPCKVDDIADSFALCHTNQNTIEWYETH